MLTLRTNRPVPTTMPTPFGREFEKLFETMLTPGFLAFGVPTSRPMVFPALNITEDETALYVEAELPGFTEEEIEINVVGTELTIKGERIEEKEEKEYTFHRRERWMGAFERTVTLPMEIEPEKVVAELTGGVLMIKLPKPEIARPRKIKVKAS